MVDEADLDITTPARGTEVFCKRPLVEFGVGAFDAAFFEELSSLSLDVSQVSTDSDEETVVEIGASCKSPSFGTAYEITFLALPDVALRYWTAIIGPNCILIKINEIGFPSWINVVWKYILQVVLSIPVDSGQVVVNLRTGGVDAFSIGVDVKVVGAGKSDAELGGTKGTIVTPLCRTDPSDVGNGETYLVCT